jgi:hypothetical protein
MACASCLRIVVLPAFGGDTIRPRWPLPIGAIMSTIRIEIGDLSSVSSRSRSSGNSGVRSLNSIRRSRPNSSSGLPSMVSTRAEGRELVVAAVRPDRAGDEVARDAGRTGARTTARRRRPCCPRGTRCSAGSRSPRAAGRGRPRGPRRPRVLLLLTVRPAAAVLATPLLVAVASVVVVVAVVVAVAFPRTLVGARFGAALRLTVAPRRDPRRGPGRGPHHHGAVRGTASAPRRRRPARLGPRPGARTDPRRCR